MSSVSLTALILHRGDDMEVDETDLDPWYREFLLDGHRDVGPLPRLLDLFVLGICLLSRHLAFVFRGSTLITR